MKFILISISILFLANCSKPKTVLICGDHVCVNKTEADQYFKENLSMYYNLYANRNKFSRFINFASGAEIHDPDSPYGRSKKIIRDSVSDKNNFFNLRIYGLFDENELDTRFIKSKRS